MPKRGAGEVREPGMTRINAVITTKQHSWLKARSLIFGGSMSFYVRKALERYIQEVKE